MTEIQTRLQHGTSAEELAYMLLEEARLRCGSLLDDSNNTDANPDGLNPDGLSMNGLYGDLGIAGYYASARLEPDRRKQLLAQAHARCDRGATGPAGSAQALADVTAAANRSLERALTVNGVLDHMHLAHLHVMSACEALDSMFALHA